MFLNVWVQNQLQQPLYKIQLIIVEIGHLMEVVRMAKLASELNSLHFTSHPYNFSLHTNFNYFIDQLMKFAMKNYTFSSFIQISFKTFFKKTFFLVSLFNIWCLLQICEYSYAHKSVETREEGHKCESSCGKQKKINKKNQNFFKNIKLFLFFANNSKTARDTKKW